MHPKDEFLASWKKGSGTFCAEHPKGEFLANGP